MPNVQSKISIICGPTSSGKTGYALKLIGDKPATLITVDSRHLYQGLPITSGWDIDQSKENIQYSGFGHYTPDQVANAVDYSKYVSELIDQDINRREIYLVGGSGFYLQSIIHPETISLTSTNPDLRQKLEKMSLEELKEALKKMSPEVYSSLNNSDQNNPRRLVRRLEIASQPFPLSKGEHKGVFSYPYQITCLPIPANHHNLIKQRIQKRLASGSLEEVKNLLLACPDRKLPIYSAIGVKQILMFIDGQITHEKLISLWLSDELNYVKRQLTWFKKQPDIFWYDESNS